MGDCASSRQFTISLARCPILKRGGIWFVRLVYTVVAIEQSNYDYLQQTPLNYDYTVDPQLKTQIETLDPQPKTV